MGLMCPQAQLTGLHSRSGELVEITRSYDRGQTEWAKVQDQLKKETSDLVSLQENLGFPIISDGALDWQDSLRPMARSLAGITLGTRYSRWFDTNTFYQKPTVTGKIASNGFELGNFFHPEFLPRSRKWKVTIPGPYTFSELSENKHYASKSDLIFDIARAERNIIERLNKGGVSLIQLSEPCLVYQPYREDKPSKSELELALNALKFAAEAGSAEFLVHTFFGDASRVLPKLLELPIHAVGFDLFETDPATLRGSTEKTLVLGGVDSRESTVEKPEWIVDKASHAVKRLTCAGVVLAPNCDLKFLPREVADEKLRSLAKAVGILGGPKE